MVVGFISSSSHEVKIQSRMKSWRRGRGLDVLAVGGGRVDGNGVSLPAAWQNQSPPHLCGTKDESVSPAEWHRLQVTTAT